MNYEFSPEDRQFRQEIRRLIEENMSPEYGSIFTDNPDFLEESFRFSQRLGAEGLLTREWPVQYGGQDAPIWSQVVFNEEMWSHNEPRGGQYMGVTWIGPALMMYGTPEQRERYLPEIASGKVQWCQGFSEPDAGSDLAALRTRADRTDEGFLINGQKIWTSYSNFANYCVLGARTSFAGPKQSGITVFLVPMDRPGITVRPIETFLGPNHFNEVFFDDVLVHFDEVLGEVDHGWEVMKAGLKFERVGVPRYARNDLTMARVLRHLDSIDQRQEHETSIATTKAHILVSRLLSYRVSSLRDQGEDPGELGTISRLWQVQVDQETVDVAMDALGVDALATPVEAGSSPVAHIEHLWRFAQTSTIAAGAIEIHKILLARSMLADEQHGPGRDHERSS